MSGRAVAKAKRPGDGPGPLDVGTRVWLRAEHLVDLNRKGAKAAERNAPARSWWFRFLRR